MLSDSLTEQAKVRIQYTTSWDLLIRYFVGAPLMISGMYLVGGAVIQIFALSPWQISEWIVDISAFVGGFAGGVWAFGHFIEPELSTLSSWLYLNTSLRVRAKWKDAEILSPLFMMSANGAWYPLNDVRKYDKSERLAIVYAIARKTRRLKDIEYEMPKSQSYGEAGNRRRVSQRVLLLAALLVGAGLMKFAYEHGTLQTSSNRAPNPRFSGVPVEPSTTQNLPVTGLYRDYSNTVRIAPLTIRTSNGGQNYFVKLVDYLSEETSMTYFIRSGQSINIDVPIGEYEIRYATGKVWYGESILFGNQTQYSKADRVFSFSRTTDGVSGYTIELISQPSGNLRTARISPSEW